MDLSRFIDAHCRNYSAALAEIRSGRKRSHWMWYIFPQLRELGKSETALYYGIRDLDEAVAYLNDPVLGQNLLEISGVLLTLESSNAREIFGWPDDMKLRSCMTLFHCASGGNPVFRRVLEKFYDGKPDGHTLRILEK